MHLKLKTAFESEMFKAKALYANQELEQSFYHLERAHILVQRNYIPHVNTHWWMLKVGWRRADVREVIGQLIRIVGSAGSIIGAVPIGNTGGANVSPTKPMPIPDDLIHYFNE